MTWRKGMRYLLERGGLHRYRAHRPEAVILTPLVASPLYGGAGTRGSGSGASRPWRVRPVAGRVRASWERSRVVRVLSRFSTGGSDEFATGAWSYLCEAATAPSTLIASDVEVRHVFPPNSVPVRGLQGSAHRVGPPRAGLEPAVQRRDRLRRQR